MVEAEGIPFVFFNAVVLVCAEEEGEQRFCKGERGFGGDFCVLAGKGVLSGGQDRVMLGWWELLGCVWGRKFVQ